MGRTKLSKLFLILILWGTAVIFYTQRKPRDFGQYTTVKSTTPITVSKKIIKWQKLLDEHLLTSFSKCDSVNESGKVKKAVLIYYDSFREDEFLHQLRWLYESIKEANTYNTENSIIDLIIYASQISKGLTDMGCRPDNADKMFSGACIFYPYSPVIFINSTKAIVNHAHILAKEKLLFNDIRYPYTFSITMCFDMFDTFKNYDYVMRSDSDTFVLPPFAFSIPTNCCLMTGLGGYASEFSNKRLMRISKDMGWENADEHGFGSTWVGSPVQVKVTAEMTFRAMHYLVLNEFTEIERAGKVGILNWPEWHFGVCLLYGQHLAVNDLLANGYCVNFTSNVLDCGSTSNDLLQDTKCWHIHCWHTDDLFSKFHFAVHRYRNLTFESLNKTIVRDYLTILAKRSDGQTV